MEENGLDPTKAGSVSLHVEEWIAGRHGHSGAVPLRETFDESGADGGPVILRFANCEMDVTRVTFRRDGREVKLEPQAFDVLCYLVEHRGEVVRKEQLLDDVWGDRFVTESALTTRIKSVRQAVGDDGSRQAIIRTVHGRGYEFIATVETLEQTPVATATPPDVTLPAAMQPLIGRESLLERLAAVLGEHRLVTLVGPGGVGKTSVGLELARRIADRYPDGVKLVELVAVGDEDATLEAVATAIDVHFRRGSSIGDAIIETLRLRRSLVVLDNCEHLVEAVASLAGRIVREAPGVSIVATSREPLGLAGEQVWSVDPLSTGDAAAEALAGGGLDSAPAVALFVERAERPTRDSSSTRRTRARLSRYAGASMGSRWRSSWQRHGPGRSTWQRSRRASMNVSVC